MPNPGTYNREYVVHNMTKYLEEVPNHVVPLADLYRECMVGMGTTLYRFEFEKFLKELFPTVNIQRLGNVKYVIGVRLHA